MSDERRWGDRDAGSAMGDMRRLREAEKSLRVLAESYKELEAENERLRVVVEAAKVYVEAMNDDQCPDIDFAFDALENIVGQLDVSGNMGGSVAPAGFPDRPPGAAANSATGAGEDHSAAREARGPHVPAGGARPGSRRHPRGGPVNSPEHKPPTSGFDQREFRGKDHAEMLRRVADYIDERNPGRLVAALWADFDEEADNMVFDIIFHHDEDAYYYDDDPDEDEPPPPGHVLIGYRDPDTGILHRDFNFNGEEQPVYGTAPAERCGSQAEGGRCVPPRGHNMGQVDIPEMHWAGPPHHIMPGEGIEGYLRRTAPEGGA